MQHLYVKFIILIFSNDDTKINISLLDVGPKLWFRFYLFIKNFQKCFRYTVKYQQGELLKDLILNREFLIF